MPLLTEEQKREALLILAIGCDQETAAQYVGAEVADLAETILADQGFADEVARAEAAVEMKHMRNVQQAAREEKNWRASVWWLERRWPDRYGRPAANAIAAGQLRSFLTSLADVIAEAIRSESDRSRLLARLQELSNPLATTEDDPAPAGGPPDREDRKPPEADDPSD